MRFPTTSSFLKNHHGVDFLCDTMKITLSADLSQYDVDDLLTNDIKAAHTEEHQAQHGINSIAEALPGLGIVAAVLGVVHTMGLLDQGTEVIGHSVGAALVGTFMGIFIGYVVLIHKLKWGNGMVNGIGACYSALPENRKLLNGLGAACHHQTDADCGEKYFILD
jgi:hypothetical protein